jgi:hypothetical protein
MLHSHFLAFLFVAMAIILPVQAQTVDPASPLFAPANPEDVLVQLVSKSREQRVELAPRSSYM